MTHIKHALIALALLGAAAARAQLPPPPPRGDMVPPAQLLATAPGLSAAQQVEVRRILLQRRDGDEQIRQKARTEIEALHARERAEHEKVEAQASDALRKLLGDDGYRRFAEWQLTLHGPRGMAPRGRGAAPAQAPPPPGGAPAAPPDEERDE